MKYKALKMPADLLPIGALPKNYGSNLRVARVGNGTVILPYDKNEEMTDDEILKALGLENKKSSAREKYIITNHELDEKHYVELTREQVALLNWLDTYGLVIDLSLDRIDSVRFEQI